MLKYATMGLNPVDRFTVRKDLLETILVTPNIGRICQGKGVFPDFSLQSSLIIAM